MFFCTKRNFSFHFEFLSQNCVFPSRYCMMYNLLLWLCCWLAAHVDVSEESEYELWSDRFGSWIGRSSKSKSPDSFKSLRFDRSKSPDSFKNLRFDRKSSSGYCFSVLLCLILFCCRICCFYVFVIFFFFARCPHLTLDLTITPKLHLVNVFSFLFDLSCITQQSKTLHG